MTKTEVDKCMWMFSNRMKSISKIDIETDKEKLRKEKREMISTHLLEEAPVRKL